MKFDLITDDNFLLYATKNYESTRCFGVAELNQDLERFVHIKRLLRKYNRNKKTNLRLLVNHIIVINNLFGPYPTNRMLFFYVDEYTYPQLASVLYFLSILQESIPEVKMSEIEIDEDLYKQLEEL